MTEDGTNMMERLSSPSVLFESSSVCFANDKFVIINRGSNTKTRFQVVRVCFGLLKWS